MPSRALRSTDRSARNACDIETVQTLHDVFAEFENDDGARVGVLTGADETFCAGADLAELASGASIGFCWAGTDKGGNAKKAWQARNCRGGRACGCGGAGACGCGAISEWQVRRQSSGCSAAGSVVRCQMAAQCDCHVLLAKVVPWTCCSRDVQSRAQEAYSIGLADRLVPAGQAKSEALALAQQLANFPQLAMLSDRASTISQWDYPEAEAIEREIEGSRPAFEQQFQSGASRFVGGVGRHGKFE